MPDKAASVAGGLPARERLVEAEPPLRMSQSQAPRRTALSAVFQLLARQRFLCLALIAAVLVVGIRLLGLDSMQTDLYGDIHIVHQFVASVLAGNWPFYYVLGVGPLYQYIIAPLIWVVGLSYYALKLGAVATSLGILIATYALARRLIDDRFALLAVIIAGVSSWLLVFSRLGISLILVPLLVTSALWLIVRFVQERQPASIVACALVSALGLYAYPQSMVLPGVSFMTLLGLRALGHPIAWIDLRRFMLASFAAALPFAWMVYQTPHAFTHGYIGGKFYADGDPIGALIHNVRAAVLAYHMEGDSIFRSNPSSAPHLDLISGLLFLVGILFWLRLPQRRLSPVLFIPFVLLHLPSVLVLGRPHEVPSAGRTLGVAPIAYILVASGLWWLVRSIAGLGWRRASWTIGASLLVTVMALNAQRYFWAYIPGLPYHDTSIGKSIAAYGDSLPLGTQVYVVGSRWEAFMPEMPYVRLVSKRPESLHELDPKELTCDRLASLQGPAVLVWSFHDPLPAPQLSACTQGLPAELHSSPKGWPVFHAAPLPMDREPSSGG